MHIRTELACIAKNVFYGAFRRNAECIASAASAVRCFAFNSSLARPTEMIIPIARATSRVPHAREGPTLIPGKKERRKMNKKRKRGWTARGSSWKARSDAFQYFYDAPSSSPSPARHENASQNKCSPFQIHPRIARDKQCRLGD